MNKIKYLLLIFVFFISCSDDDDTILPSISSTFTNLHAPQTGGMGQPIGGDFTKFNFSTGQITTDTQEWDIAFRGTTIIVNGGTKIGLNDEPNRNGSGAVGIANGTFSSITSADVSSLSQDGSNSPAIPTGSGNGWYNYSGPPTFLITPIPGKILIVKTHDDRYAKVEILSYYKDAPANPNFMSSESRYYTFNYLYNPNEKDFNLN